MGIFFHIHMIKKPWKTGKTKNISIKTNLDSDSVFSCSIFTSSGTHTVHSHFFFEWKKPGQIEILIVFIHVLYLEFLVLIHFFLNERSKAASKLLSQFRFHLWRIPQHWQLNHQWPCNIPPTTYPATIINKSGISITFNTSTCSNSTTRHVDQMNLQNIRLVSLYIALFAAGV